MSVVHAILTTRRALVRGSGDERRHGENEVKFRAMSRGVGCRQSVECGEEGG